MVSHCCVFIRSYALSLPVTSGKPNPDNVLPNGQNLFIKTQIHFPVEMVLTPQVTIQVAMLTTSLEIMSPARPYIKASRLGGRVQCPDKLVKS